MNYHANSPKEAVTNLICAYAQKRSLSDTLECLTKDIVWFGICIGEQLSGKENVKKTLRENLIANPFPYLTEYKNITENKISENHAIVNVNAIFSPQNKPNVSYDLFFTFCCILRGDFFQISFCHISSPIDIQKTQISEETISIAIKQTGITFWTYNIAQQYIHQPDSFHFGLDPFIYDIPNSLRGSGRIHPEDETIFFTLFDDLISAKKTDTCVIRWKDPGSNDYWWNRVTCTTIFNESGKAIKIIGSFLNVTEKMEAEKKFSDTITYHHKVMTEKTLLTGHCSITENVILQVTDNTSLGILEKFGSHRETFFQRVADCLPIIEERKQYLSLFLQKPLMDNFEKGITNHRLDCQIILPGDKIRWIQQNVDVVKSPDSNGLFGFLSVTDITAEKEAEMKLLEINKVIDKVVNLDYDLLTLMDIPSDSYVMLGTRSDRKVSIPNEGCFSIENEKFILDNVVEEEIEFCLKEFSLPNLIAKLEENDTYTIHYRTKNDSKHCQNKKAQLFYFDSHKKKIGIALSDITDVISEQEQKNNLLHSALLAAEEASAAKSEFFSRMSHEIRTPMNAIIGMNNIAMHSLEDKKQMVECLSIIESSSTFLLSLINDILDMSRIESGKMSLKLEQIPMNEFLNSIYSVCSTQAKTKNVQYEQLIEQDLDKYYLGDSLKLQQAIINILSNAIKFTPEGGTVSFSASQIKRVRKDAYLRFIIQDTGCGIDEEFLPLLFEPFLQENNKTTATHNGTGLGLAICKSIVDLMNGSIRVESTKGVGSIFTVDIKLGIIENSQTAPILSAIDALNAESTSEKNNEMQKKLNFVGKKILLAEDHPINVEVAVKILSQKGFIVEVAANGRLAVNMFIDMPSGYYDAILMDIRMPELDGLEATKLIRLQEKADAQTIPIIAMTANAFEDDVQKSKDAGMNAHLIKPINPSTLFQTLSNFLK